MTPVERLGTIGILELVDVCAREGARSMSMFERLGDWVATTRHPGLQRLFATAAHRHAWHADLWAGRSPTVPIAAVVDDVIAVADAADDTDRWAAYVTALGLLVADLDELRSRVDPDLDPGTVRVVDLVLRDARELADALVVTQP